mmetsp:Transcript_126469/g.300341  ORF Transcript_126469/g.300341 Transcript_126469/m.300341 type:complete len:200 (-) Transcript_126469:836-1435(-)
MRPSPWYEPLGSSVQDFTNPSTKHCPCQQRGYEEAGWNAQTKRPAGGCEIEHPKEEEQPNFIKGMRFMEQIIDGLLPTVKPESLGGRQSLHIHGLPSLVLQRAHEHGYPKLQCGNGEGHIQHFQESCATSWPNAPFAPPSDTPVEVVECCSQQASRDAHQSKDEHFHKMVRYLREPAKTHWHAGPKQAHSVPFKDRSQS